MSTFTAMVVRQTEEEFDQEIGQREIDDLPEGEVLIRVRYSSLNYKDALSATGHRGVTRHYPHTPGIDAAGVVEESASEAFEAGDEVLVTGYDLGMNTAGGYGQYIRVPAAWVMPLPAGLSALESMIYGTAGFTAALSVSKLEEGGVGPDRGEILVTGRRAAWAARRSAFWRGRVIGWWPRPGNWRRAPSSNNWAPVR